jgi:serine/threonine protein kinase
MCRALLQVGDFGLSLKMDHLETHVSNVYQGTMTHMAPETMLDGRVSKAADVYGERLRLRVCACSGAVSDA